MITPFVLGLALGLGIGLIYRWQWLDRFRRFQGRRFAASFNWQKLWTLETQFLQKIEQQEQDLQYLRNELQQTATERQDLRELLTHLPLAYYKWMRTIIYCGAVQQRRRFYGFPCPT